ETLKNEVGVHASFYGGVASSPIIRGLDGPRVLITQNGLDAGDVSRVGADHVVAVETSTARQIEVLRGPATLFYGSGAIGGVVNVVDNRVPTSSDTLFEWLLQYNDVANESQGSFSLQKGLPIGSENFAVYLDGFWRDAGDYKLPKSYDPVEEYEAGVEEEVHEDDEYSSRLVNSASKSSGFTLGSSYLFEQGFIGFSYGTMSRDYGIPSHASHEDETHVQPAEYQEIEEGTHAKMQQNRLQLLSKINFEKSFIKQLALKSAYTDYQHQEIEEGMIGTTFTNKSIEMKADLFHQEYKGWQGAWTLHYKSSDFKAAGIEAFTPPAKTHSIAGAWLEEQHFGEVLWQLGVRLEQTTIDAEGDAKASLIGSAEQGQNNQQTDNRRSFKQEKFIPVSLSSGLVWDYQAGYNVGLSLALSQRAPSAAELFSFGPHIGTNTFEIGALFEVEKLAGNVETKLSSQAVNVETAYSFDLTWRKFTGDFGFVVSAFYNQIKDYYYQQDTGLVFKDSVDEYDAGLPIFIYQQNDVDMVGLEAELIYQISSPLKATLFGDYIKAQLTNNEAANNFSLPRIPPMRLGALFNYQGNDFDGEFSVNHYFTQNDIAPLESPTQGYTLIDMKMNFHLDSVGDYFGNDIVLYIKANNLTDEVAKVHSSFLKEVTPLPGRNFSVGLRGSF
ncbi:MAG: TonB-dependent receptor, partial [Colwellia sp.]|nr:TonB-dependent receptor [Colwellia sp.]